MIENHGASMKLENRRLWVQRIGGSDDSCGTLEIGHRELVRGADDRLRTETTLLSLPEDVAVLLAGLIARVAAGDLVNDTGEEQEFNGDGMFNDPGMFTVNFETETPGHWDL